MKYIFDCQQRDWCKAVLHFHPSEVIAGRIVWSVFDKHRERSEYKVPLVVTIKEDFNYFKKLITEVENNQNNNSNNSNNSSFYFDYKVTLTLDPNPW